MYDILINGNLEKLLELSDLDIMAGLFAAVIHDFKHPGYNNGFQINTRTDIAFQFNGKSFENFINLDKSVLENYHLAESFKLLNKKDCNIFEKLD